MPTPENEPNLNSPESNPGETGKGVEVSEKTENRLGSEGLENQKTEQQGDQEVSGLNKSIKDTKEGLTEARGELGLPDTQEDPPSVTRDKERLEELGSEGASENQEQGPDSPASRESREGGEDLKENDLIVSDDQLELSKNILEDNQIPHKEKEYKKRQEIRGEADYDVPGEFVVSINNPERPDEPADFEFTKQVFQLFKDSEIAVRYGKNPEKG